MVKRNQHKELMHGSYNIYKSAVHLEYARLECHMFSLDVGIETGLLLQADIIDKPSFNMTVDVYWNVEMETYVSYVYMGHARVTKHTCSCLGPFYGFSPEYWRSADKKQIRQVMLGGEDELQSSSDEEL